jgi:hypothetical protein
VFLPQRALIVRQHATGRQTQVRHVRTFLAFW